MIVHTNAIQVLPELLMVNLILCLHNGDTLNTYMKEFCSNQIIIDKIAAMRMLIIFLDCIE